MNEIKLSNIGEYVDPVYPPNTGEPTGMMWLDVGIFAVLMLLSVLFMWRNQSTRMLWIVQLLALGWFGFFRQGCPCPVGSVGNVSISLFHPTYLLSILALIWFCAPLITALFFGRVFCGGVCPLGTVQDVLGYHARRKRSIISPAVENILRLGTYAVLVATLYYAYMQQTILVCEYDPFVTIFRLTATTTMWIVSGSFLLLCVFISRPFCRFLCPYGALLSLVTRCSWRKRQIDPSACAKCRLCTKSCPMNCIQNNQINFSDCILCGRCLKSCRKNAITTNNSSPTT